MKNRTNELVASTSLLIAAVFVTPCAFIYFWQNIVTPTFGIVTPAYWTMFALLSGLRAVAGTATRSMVSDLWKGHVDADKLIWHNPINAWVTIGALYAVTFLCK